MNRRQFSSLLFSAAAPVCSTRRPGSGHDPGRTQRETWRTTRQYEGGIRAPLIARWPGVVPPGQVSQTPVVSTDVYSTFLDVTGAKPKPGYKLDGISIARLHNPKKKLPERDIIWYYPLAKDHILGGKSAMSSRDARWKLIEFIQTCEKQLLDLIADPSESTDQASRQPEIVQSMSARIAVWRTATVKDVT